MWTEDRLSDLLTTPSDALIEDMKRLPGSLLVLGAGGKMGPSLCVLAKRAGKRVIAVSRFSDAGEREFLEGNGVETIAADLLDHGQRAALPQAENVIYMAGRKFGTRGREWLTWAMNASLPAFIAERFRGARAVVFSSGNVYPLVPPPGCTEQVPPGPVGEYAMSCLARERAFEYAAEAYGTKVLLYRLNYAADLRYGVLYDIAGNILEGRPISLRIPCFNIIWQGSANEIALRSLLHAASPAVRLNVTGPEILPVKATALRLAEILGKTPLFEGEEGEDAYLSDASKAMALFGRPAVTAETLIEWQGQWLLDGGRGLGKSTHFDERKGAY
ncbi:MAG: NAD(P)-dependent oxidoreductase [Oscillospiraceae bacterium]|jgi:nucleoside-diphosphate-sugar epimerase|nr:NAD(P)-dependent oxidoreductase [Oscillospiraceae bacterium]